MNKLIIFVLAIAVGYAYGITNPPSCRLKDFKGSWAFTESGTVRQNNIDGVRLNNVGSVTLDGKGNVISGWASVKIGQTVTNSSEYSGNYTIINPCNIRLNLKRGSTRYSLQGVVSKQKNQLFTYSSSQYDLTVGEFSRITEKCNLQSISGVWVGAGLRILDASQYSLAFAQTIVCPKKKNGECTLYYSGNPYIPDITDAPTTANLSKGELCRYEFTFPFDQHVAVKHSKGIYMVDTHNANDYSPYTATKYVAGTL